MLYLCYAIVVLLLISLRALLIFGVKNELKVRDTNAPKVWLILTVLLGFIPALVLACFVPKTQKTNKMGKLIIPAFVIIIIAIIVMLSVVIPPLEKEDYDEAQNSFSYFDLVYKNENGEDVIYDKMGVAYTWDEYISGYKYYDRADNEYVSVCDESNARIGFKNIKTGEQFIDPFYCDNFKDGYTGYFDRDGYLCLFSYEEDDKITIHSDDDMITDSVYFDADGNLYYYDSNFNYDENGNVVFNKDYKLSKFKYSDLTPDELSYFDNVNE